MLILFLHGWQSTPGGRRSQNSNAIEAQKNEPRKLV